jgi:hypothetical protein
VDLLLDTVTRREVVVGLAVAGGCLAAAGSIRQTRFAPPLSKALIYVGYAISGVSVLLFVVAGFRS